MNQHNWDLDSLNDFESLKDFFHRKEVLFDPQVCELITKSETRNWKILKTRCLVITQQVLNVRVTLAGPSECNQ